MKKILLVIFFVGLSNLIYSQSQNQSQQINSDDEEVIIMSKAKHEALRHDMEDYKVLLVKYQSIRVEQEILTADLDRQSKLLNAKNETLVQAQNRIDYLESEANDLRIKIETQSQKITELNQNYRNMDRLYYVEKNKVYHMKKGQTQLYMWRGLTLFFFCAMLVVGTNH